MTCTAILDCGSGNLASVTRALQAAGATELSIVTDAAGVAAADRVVLPGQGAFAVCATGLQRDPGVLAALHAHAARGRPFLGICVGMQLMAQRGLEDGVTAGLGWISGQVARMEAPGLRLPQMGWNTLAFPAGAHPLLEGIAPGAYAYFVHSYALRDYAEAEVVATTEYGGTVPALVARGSCAGTQFHVEKSQGVGLRILRNFLCWSP